METPRRHQSEPLDPALEFIERAAPWLVIALIVVVVVLLILMRVAGAV
jgi:hypothetical protein